METIGKIKIQWKYKPEEFTIEVLKENGVWVTFAKIDNNNSDLTELKFSHLYA